jgi:DNA-binding NtrC family response regulator
MNLELNILLVDDEEIVRQTIGYHLRTNGHNVTSVADGESALHKVEQGDFDLALIDYRMPKIDGLSLLVKFQEIRPELSVVIITGHGNIDTAIQALRLGATDFLTKPIKFPELQTVLEKSERIRGMRRKESRLLETIQGLQTSEDERIRNRTLIGVSPDIEEVRKQIALVTESGCQTVLLRGDTGTGKEVVARELHYSQPQADQKPFIAVSCPALPDTLFESELFGHTKGSFTGANRDKAGCFELADGGTLFLDEIGDLSLSAQSKILRVLETRAVRRVGGSREIKTNLLLVAATNINLEKQITLGNFRQDLFYRLNVFNINLSPLRQRPEDIMVLANHFLKTGNRKAIPSFTDEARLLLTSYPFPGNVRELKNIIERASMICKSTMIGIEHLGIRPEEEMERSRTGQQSDLEKGRILQVLEQNKWNRGKTAEEMNLSYETLRYRMKKHGIS